MQTLIDIVNNPRKYDGFANLPLSCDAAEGLLPFWDQLNAKTQNKVETILIRSGRYEKAA